MMRMLMMIQLIPPSRLVHVMERFNNIRSFSRVLSSRSECVVDIHLPSHSCPNLDTQWPSLSSSRSSSSLSLGIDTHTLTEAFIGGPKYSALVYFDECRRTRSIDREQNLIFVGMFELLSSLVRERF